MEGELGDWATVAAPTASLSPFNCYRSMGGMRGKVQLLSRASSSSSNGYLDENEMIEVVGLIFDKIQRSLLLKFF